MVHLIEGDQILVEEPSSRTRKKAEEEARTSEQAGTLAQKLARLESDNATLRQQQEKAQAQLPDPKAGARPADSPSRTVGPSQVPSLGPVERTIQRLQAKCDQAERETADARSQLANANKKIAELEKQIKETPLRAAGAEKTREPNPPRQSTGVQTHPVGPAAVEVPRSPRSESLPPRPAHDERPGPQSVEPEAKLELHELLPWEYPGAQAGQPSFPKWKDWPMQWLEQVGEFAEKALAALPTEISKQGDRKVAASMREWFANPKNADVLKELSHRIVVLVLCTERSQRRSHGDQVALASLALGDAIQNMRLDRAEQAQEITHVFEEFKNNFEWLARELVRACRGKGLKHNEQTGRKRLLLS